MSIQAITWALEDAPDVPPHLVATLLGLANHAGRDGRGTFPSKETLTLYNRKTTRQTKRDLDELQSLGLIRQGDQRFLAHVRPDRRPMVWDLAMERVRERGDVDVTSQANGVTYRVERGDIQGHHGVTSTSPEPKEEPKEEPTPSSADADGDAGLFAVPDQPTAKGKKAKGKEHLDSSFEAFWKVYPRKINKKGARLRWSGAVAKLSSAELILAAERYAAQVAREGRDPSRIAYAATWLHQERWTDPDETSNGHGSGSDYQSVKAWLVEQHHAGRAKPVEERSGLRYYPPPLPDDVTTIEQGAAFHAEQIREWIKTNHEQIIQRILDREGRGAAAS
jgi:hypothetical protein